MGAATAAKTSCNETRAAWGAPQGLCIVQEGEHDAIACDIYGFTDTVHLRDPITLEREYRENLCTEEKSAYLSHADEDRKWSNLAHANHLAVFERIPGVGRLSLLETGSGPGFFSKMALGKTGFGETRRALYRALAEAGIGHEAMVIAVKS